MATKEAYLGNLELGITEDYRKLVAARKAGEITLELALEESMNDRLDDYSEIVHSHGEEDGRANN